MNYNDPRLAAVLGGDFFVIGGNAMRDYSVQAQEMKKQRAVA